MARPRQAWRPSNKITPPQVAEAFNQSDALPRVHLPDIHPAKVLIVKDKLPHGFMFPPVETVPSLNMSSTAFSQSNKPVSISIPPVTALQALFSNPRYAFRAQEWVKLAMDDTLRLHRIPPLVSFLVGWFAESFKHCSDTGHLISVKPHSITSETVPQPSGIRNVYLCGLYVSIF